MLKKPFSSVTLSCSAFTDSAICSCSLCNFPRSSITSFWKRIDKNGLGKIFQTRNQANWAARHDCLHRKRNKSSFATIHTFPKKFCGTSLMFEIEASKDKFQYYYYRSKCCLTKLIGHVLLEFKNRKSWRNICGGKSEVLLRYFVWKCVLLLQQRDIEFRDFEF